MDEKRKEICQECVRQQESCLYTSTSFYIWLKVLRGAKIAFTVIPLILGGLASWKLLTTIQLESVKIFTSISALLAGLLPTIYAALKLDDSTEAVTEYAAKFKKLQDRFRQTAKIYKNDDIGSLEERFNDLMDEMDAARATSITPPEFVFKMARRKIQTEGHYNFDCDSSSENKQE